MHGGHSYLRERIFEVAISSKNLDTRLSSAGVLLANAGVGICIGGKNRKRRTEAL